MSVRLADLETQPLCDWIASNGGYMRVLEQVLRAMDNNPTSAKQSLVLMKGVLEQAVEYMDAINADRVPSALQQPKTEESIDVLVKALQIVSTCNDCKYCRQKAQRALKEVGRQ